MGYETKYKIEIIPDNQKLYDILVEDTGFHEEEAVTWYDWKDDCKTISADNPGYLVVVTGEGEENGDIWKSAILNGEEVWSWRLDFAIPGVPKEIISLSSDEFKKYQVENVTNKILELQDEIDRLKELGGLR